MSTHCLWPQIFWKPFCFNVRPNSSIGRDLNSWLRDQESHGQAESTSTGTQGFGITNHLLPWLNSLYCIRGPSESQQQLFRGTRNFRARGGRKSCHMYTTLGATLQILRLESKYQVKKYGYRVSFQEGWWIQLYLLTSKKIIRSNNTYWELYTKNFFCASPIKMNNSCTGDFLSIFWSVPYMSYKIYWCLTLGIS